MSGSQATGAGLDVRRRRILFRSWHRGMREMDLVLGRFADARLRDLSEAELDDLEVLMEAPDGDIFSWLTGQAQTPSAFDTPIFRKIRDFHAPATPSPGEAS